MRAMVLEAPGRALTAVELPDPQPGPGQILVEVKACGVCRTDLHVLDGDLPFPGHRVVPGHEVVGRVLGTGAGATRFQRGDRVGIPWLGSTCGECTFCRSGRENLCGSARFTGYHLDGGFASRAVADERYAFRLPERFGDAEAAPLLCAGLIGYRSWKPVRDARRLGIYGFGAAGHIVAQLARHAGQEFFAFTRRDRGPSVDLARSLGAAWVGTSDQPPPRPLDAAILFAPAGELVPAALRAVDRGGMVVCAGIHMTDIPTFPYSLLWGERSVRSVANLTRADGAEFLELAGRIPVRSQVTTLPLELAGQAIEDLRAGQVAGAVVLVPRGGSA
jgi:propanol-preferring alcohol dehydrogenase